MDRTGRLSVVAEGTGKEVGWSARRKADAVMRLLRGEDLDEVSRELRVEAHRLAAWRDEFMAGGLEGLKARPFAPEDRRLKEAERKIGELTLENEILLAATRKRGLLRFPWVSRRQLRPPPLGVQLLHALRLLAPRGLLGKDQTAPAEPRSEEHTSELQSRENLVCRLL